MLTLWVIFYLFVKFGVSWFFEHEHAIGLKKYALRSELFVSSLTILMIAKTINIFSRVFIWDYVVARILKGLVPLLLIQCVALSTYIIAFLIIIGMIFGKSVVGVLTALGGIGVVIGLSAQRLFLDAFSGISINIDRSFTLGDVIKITNQDYTLMGKVTKISWRLTTILTSENTQISIPNSVISGVPVINLSKPTPVCEFQEIYYFSPHSPYHFIEEILNNALMSVVEMGYIEKDPKPKIFLSKINQQGSLEISIIYCVDLSKNTHNEAKHFLHTAILKHIKASELYFDHLQTQNEQHKYTQIISDIPLFSCLNKEETDFLVANSVEHGFSQKTSIVEQGKSGTSMYIIKQGFVSVHVQDKNGQTSIVSILNPGDFFGEMSLLTGQKRSATVISESDVITYEISKDTIQHLLSNNKKLFEEFAKITAHKAFSTQEHLKKLSNIQEEKKNLFKEYLLKIKKFFN